MVVVLAAETQVSIEKTLSLRIKVHVWTSRVTRVRIPEIRGGEATTTSQAYYTRRREVIKLSSASR